MLCHPGGRYFYEDHGLIPARGGSKGVPKEKYSNFIWRTFDCMDNRKGHAIRVVG